MRFKLTKHNKLLICTLGLLSVFSLLSTSVKTNFVESLANGTIEGYYAKVGTNAALDNITFELEENDAPRDSTKYKVSSGSLKVLRADGTTNIVADNTEAITKTGNNSYEITTSAFSAVGELNVGDTIELNGDFVRDDCTLHIKQTKIYVYSSTSLVTVPHKVTNISEYLENVPASKDLYAGKDWAFLIYPEELPIAAMLRTGDDGYYPTNKNDIWINGVASANCNFDALRRRDQNSNEIYINASKQVGKDNPDVGTLVVIDGIFNYKNYVEGKYSENPHVSLEPGESFGIEVNLLAMQKVGFGKDDYVQVDLKSYLIEQFAILYNLELYDLEHFEFINNVQKQLKTDLEPLNTAKEIYAAYNSRKANAESKPLLADGFATFKKRYIKEIKNYVDLSNYYEVDQNSIELYIEQCTQSINDSLTTQEVLNALLYGKALIDRIKTRSSKIEQAVLNSVEGYEEYLQPYDNVTLDDLSLGNSLDFHGKTKDRENDINTNIEEKNQFNFFAPSPENKNGNVVFNFKYKSSFKPTTGANVVIVLRGIKYVGYKFCIGTNSNGFMFMRTYSNNHDSFAGRESTFPSLNNEYNVSVSAIDLKEGNRTLVRMVVNGTTYLNQIIDSLSFATNPRVSLSSNDEKSSNVDGVATISSYHPVDEARHSSLYCGRFSYESGSKDNRAKMYLSLKNNDLKYDSNGFDFYALSKDNIKLFRDDEEYTIGRTDSPVLKKYSEKSYQLNISKLLELYFPNDEEEDRTLYPGDVVTISGYFSYFNEDNSTKLIFEVGISSFIFKGTNKPWVADVSLEDAKDDASKQFNFYRSDVFQSVYDEEGKKTINNLVEAATKLINSADTVERVTRILDRVSLSISGVKNAFEQHVDKAVSVVNSYKENEYNLYRQEELATIQSIKEIAASDIRKCLSIEEIDQVVLEAKARIDAVLTDKELSEVELNDAIYHQISEIKNRYAALMNEGMTPEEIERLNSETLTAIERVKACKSIDEVKKAANSYLNAHPISGEGSEKKNKSTLIIVLSVVSGALLLAGAGTATFFILRKRKKPKASE